MAHKLNMELMKKKLQALKDRENKKAGIGKDTKFWKPKDSVPKGQMEGNATVRIVPTADGDSFREYHFHYLELPPEPGDKFPKRKSILCPQRNFNEECPICDFASHLWNEGAANNNDEDKKLAKALFAKERYFSPILVRGEEEKGVRVWAYGKEAYDQFIGLVTNEEYGDITDVDKGLDIDLTYSLPKSKDAFPTTKLTPKRKESPLAQSKAALKKVLDSIPDVDAEVGKRLSSKEVQDLLNQFLGNTSDDENGSEKYGDDATGDGVDDPMDPDAAIKELDGEEIPY